MADSLAHHGLGKLVEFVGGFCTYSGNLLNRRKEMWIFDFFNLFPKEKLGRKEKISKHLEGKSL